MRKQTKPNDRGDLPGTLKYHMTQAQRSSMGSLPTWHSTCFEKTGVSRPGKTARDRWKRTGLHENYRERIR